MSDQSTPFVLNPTKRLLEQGGFSLMFSIRMSTSVDIALAAKGAGYDCLYVDLEHGALTIPQAGQIFSTAVAAGITPFVRVPEAGTHDTQQLLDLGAMGIIAPHIAGPKEAERAVARCKFPPLGVRSSSSSLPQQLLTNMPLVQLQKRLDEETMVLAMIESASGLENVDGIAATKGVNVLLVGTSDLCVELGIPGQFTSDVVLKAYERIIKAANKHGKYVCLGGGIKGGSVSVLKTFRDMGVRMISVGNDSGMLFPAMRERVKQINEVLK